MLNVDTYKLKQCGNDIVKLSKELDVLLENMYYRICNVPTVTGEWLGAASELFVKQANNVEKPIAIQFKKTLKNFGDDLITAAEQYEATIKEVIQ